MANTIGNTSWAAVFPANAVIKIERKGSGVVNTVTTQITNFSEGGGAKETESIAHFGNAFLTVLKPQEDFEVELEADFKDTRWFQTITDSITVSSTGAGSFIEVKSGGDQDEYKVKVEWKVGSDAYKLVYYNARSVTVEKDSPADDRLTGTITFKVSPTDALGSPQKFEWECSDTYSTVIGSGIAGSYGSFEKIQDALFGYSPGSMV